MLKSKCINTCKVVVRVAPRTENFSEDVSCLLHQHHQYAKLLIYLFLLTYFCNAALRSGKLQSCPKPSEQQDFVSTNEKEEGEVWQLLLQSHSQCLLRFPLGLGICSL